MPQGILANRFEGSGHQPWTLPLTWHGEPWTPTGEPSGLKFEEGRSHKGAELDSGLTFGRNRLNSLKASAHWEWAPFFETTLHGSEWRLLILLRHPLKAM